MLSEAVAIPRLVRDDLEDRGVSEHDAASIGQQVATFLQCGRWAPELVIAGVTDHAGRPHLCVLPKLPAGAECLDRLDLPDYRRRARRAVIEGLAVETRLQDDNAGTPV